MQEEEEVKASRALKIEDLKSDVGISSFVQNIHDNIPENFEYGQFVRFMTDAAFQFCQAVKPNLPAAYVLHRIQKMPKKGEIISEVSRCVRKFYDIEDQSSDMFKFMDEDQQQPVDDFSDSQQPLENEPVQKILQEMSDDDI